MSAVKGWGIPSLWRAPFSRARWPRPRGPVGRTAILRDSYLLLLLWKVLLELVLEDFLRDPDGGPRPRPPGVEGQVGDDLDELGLREAVLPGPVQVGSCSVFPPAMSAATVTRLRSPGQSSSRDHTRKLSYPQTSSSFGGCAVLLLGCKVPRYVACGRRVKAQDRYLEPPTRPGPATPKYCRDLPFGD
jgi:hypothetical protein